MPRLAAGGWRGRGLVGDVMRRRWLMRGPDEQVPPLDENVSNTILFGISSNLNVARSFSQRSEADSSVSTYREAADLPCGVGHVPQLAPEPGLGVERRAVLPQPCCHSRAATGALFMQEHCVIDLKRACPGGAESSLLRECLGQTSHMAD